MSLHSLSTTFLVGHHHHSPDVVVMTSVKKRTLTKFVVLFLMAFVLGLLSGCGSTVKEVSVLPDLPRPTLSLEDPEPITLEKNIPLIVAKNPSSPDTIIIGTTPEGYKAYQRNLEVLQGRILLLMEYLRQYRIFYGEKQ